jgi:hypothetical protein
MDAGAPNEEKKASFAYYGAHTVSGGKGIPETGGIGGRRDLVVRGLGTELVGSLIVDELCALR